MPEALAGRTITPSWFRSAASAPHKGVGSRSKHQVLYYGVLAPNAILPEAVVASACGGRKKKVEGQSKNHTWAELMERAFAFQLLVCPVCGGPRRVLEAVTDRETIRAILGKHGLSSEPPKPVPAKQNPQLELPL